MQPPVIEHWDNFSVSAVSYQTSTWVTQENKKILFLEISEFYFKDVLKEQY